MVDPEPLDDYPGGPRETGLLWKYHVDVARKAADGEVSLLTHFINVNLCENDVDISDVMLNLFVKS